MKDKIFFAKKIIKEIKKYTFRDDFIKNEMLADALNDAFRNDKTFVDWIADYAADLPDELKLVLFTYTGFCPCCFHHKSDRMLSFEDISKVMGYDSWQIAREKYASALQEIAVEFLYDYFTDIYDDVD